MFCKNCGEKINTDVKFCGKCGSVIITDKDGTVIKSSETAIPTQENQGDGHKSYIAKIIHLKSRRRLYFSCFLLILACLFFFFQKNYIANLISGPREIDSMMLERELLSNKIKNININLQLNSDLTYPAGYTHITQTIDKSTNNVKSEETNSEYYLTVIGKHVLILEGVPDQVPKNNFKGVVVPLPADLQNKLVADFNDIPELKGLGDSILPFMLSNRGIMGLDDFWTFLFSIILFCCSAIIVFRRTMDSEDKKHSVFRKISLAGYQNIDDLSDDFVKSTEAGMIKIGGYRLSDKFLSKNSFFSFNIYPLSQMYWTYKKVINRRVNFVPTGKGYEIIMHFKPNETVAIGESEEKVNQHLLIIATLCPEAKFGYTE